MPFPAKFCRTFSVNKCKVKCSSKVQCYGKKCETVTPSRTLHVRKGTDTYCSNGQTFISINVCLWIYKKINKTNAYSAIKIISHPNSMRKILSGKKRLFSRFQLYGGMGIYGHCTPGQARIPSK